MSESLEKPRFRRAKVSDVLFILDLLNEFHSTHLQAYGIAQDDRSTLLTIREVIDGGICLVGRKSCAGAIIKPFAWNRKILLAHTAFWYFKTPREVTIFEALMEECRKAGATHIAAASTLPKNAIARRYSRLGLQECETQSIKKFTCPT